MNPKPWTACHLRNLILEVNRPTRWAPTIVLTEVMGPPINGQTNELGFHWGLCHPDLIKWSYNLGPYFPNWWLSAHLGSFSPRSQVHLFVFYARLVYSLIYPPKNNWTNRTDKFRIPDSPITFKSEVGKSRQISPRCWCFKALLLVLASSPGASWKSKAFRKEFNNMISSRYSGQIS